MARIIDLESRRQDRKRAPVVSVWCDRLPSGEYCAGVRGLPYHGWGPDPEIAITMLAVELAQALVAKGRR